MDPLWIRRRGLDVESTLWTYAGLLVQALKASMLLCLSSGKMLGVRLASSLFISRSISRLDVWKNGQFEGSSRFD